MPQNKDKFNKVKPNFALRVVYSCDCTDINKTENYKNLLDDKMQFNKT